MNDGGRYTIWSPVLSNPPPTRPTLTPPFTATGEVSRERWYLLTSLSSRQCRPKELLQVFRNHWSVENSLHHVKDRSWDEGVHTLRRPGLGEVYAALVNTGLNALRLEGWFPARMSLPLRAKTCAFRPMQTINRLYGPTP